MFHHFLQIRNEKHETHQIKCNEIQFRLKTKLNRIETKRRLQYEIKDEEEEEEERNKCDNFPRQRSIHRSALAGCQIPDSGIPEFECRQLEEASLYNADETSSLPPCLFSPPLPLPHNFIYNAQKLST